MQQKPQAPKRKLQIGSHQEAPTTKSILSSTSPASFTSSQKFQLQQTSSDRLIAPQRTSQQ
eukprot:7681044-Ditylum_brightwellii.AAC.1